MSADWPPPSWPEYEASLAYTDDLDEPETKRRRKAPAVICLLLLVAGVGAAAYWFGQDDGVEVEGTSTGGEQRALVDDPSPEPDTDAGPLEEGLEEDSSPGDESSEETAPADIEPADGTGTTETDATDDNPTDGGGGNPGDDPTGGGDSTAGSPVDALEAMFTATNNSDCPALLDTLSVDSRAMFGSDPNSQINQCEQTLGQAPPGDMAIQSASVTSETEQVATVKATYTEHGASQTEDFHIVREDSAWKVDLSTF